MGGRAVEGVLAVKRERGMRLPEGEVWLVLTGCGADRLRSVCACSITRDRWCAGLKTLLKVRLPNNIEKETAVSIFTYLYLTLEPSLLLFCFIHSRTRERLQ